jgi:hypothetical protein
MKSVETRLTFSDATEISDYVAVLLVYRMAASCFSNDLRFTIVQ